MEELIKKSVSMPCHKYMVRSIKNEEDKLAYARAFISKLYETGRHEQDIMVCYSATSAFKKDPGLHFLSYRGENLSNEEFYHKILGDDSVPHYKSCREYIKTHPENISAVCKMCPSYTGYTNRNNTAELAILKFIASSKANLDFFLTIANAKYFRSCYDLAENTLSGVPFVVPLPRLCFTVIQKCGPEYYEQNLLAMTDEDRLNSLQSRIVSILRSRYNVNSAFPDYIKIFPTLWKIFVSEISSADFLSKPDVKGFVEFTTILDRAPGKSAPKAVSSRNTFTTEKGHTVEIANTTGRSSAISDTAKEDSLTAPTHETQNQPDRLPVHSKSQECVSPVPATEIIASDIKIPMEAEKAENTNSPLNESPKSYPDTIGTTSPNDIDISTLPVDNNIKETQDFVPEVYAEYPPAPDTYQLTKDQTNPAFLLKDESLEAVDATSTEQYTIVENDQPLSINVSESEKESDKSTPDAETIELLPIKINEIALPVITQTDLKNYCALVSDENADFVTVSVVRDQMIGLECLQDENGAHVLLIWIPIYQKFYYAYFTSLHRRLKEILAYKSIRKVCYQPYYIYSLSKIYAVPARNVYSIFSVHTACTGFNVSMTYRDIIEMYTGGRRFERMVGNIPIRNEFMGGLPFYDSICHNLTRIVNGTPALKDKVASALLFDEVNGVSYMRCINFVDDELLFSFQKDGTLKYNDNHVKQVKRDGALVTYVIENSNYSHEARREVYLHVLTELAKTGRFRKLNIQLVMMTGDIMMLFIGANGFELLDTTIKVMFSKFATDCHIDSFHVLISREWFLAEQDSSPAHIEDYAAEEDSDVM